MRLEVHRGAQGRFLGLGSHRQRRGLPCVTSSQLKRFDPAERQICTLKLQNQRIKDVSIQAGYDGMKRSAPVGKGS